MTASCSTSFGHEDCGFNPTTLEHEGHKAAANAYERSKNKVYKRKIQHQKGLDANQSAMTFKKGR